MTIARARQQGRVRSRTTNRTNTPTQTIMKTGLSTFRGQVSEEYLSQLKPWSKEIKVFREMQDDVVIGALFESIRTPLLAAPFEVVKGGESSEDEIAKEFIITELLENPNFEWINHVGEMLEFLEVGFALCEKVLIPGTDGRLHLRDLMPIGQDSLDQWGDADDFGRVTSFQQRDKLGKVHSAPMDKLLHFTFRGQKRNPQGQGILRALYRPWYFKKNLETLEAIGVERDVGNAPVVELKEGVRYKQTDLDALASALEGFRMDEAMYVIMPGGAKLTAYGGGNKVYDVRSIITAWQHLIRQRFFADFLAFGSENIGTQALAREMTTFFGLALRSIQNSMLSIWNRQLIPWLFAWNNWQLEKFPTLTWLSPGDTNVQSLAQAYTMLINANLLSNTDTELRTRIRTQLGLHKIDEDIPIVPNIISSSGQQLPGEDKNGQGGSTGGVIASERPNFDEFHGSELVDTIIKFILDLFVEAREGRQGLEVASTEIADVFKDAERLHDRGQLSREEFIDIFKIAKPIQKRLDDRIRENISKK